MVSLNETFDAATTERFAYDRGLPPQVFWLLVSLGLLTSVPVLPGSTLNPAIDYECSCTRDHRSG